MSESVEPVSTSVIMIHVKTQTFSLVEEVVSVSCHCASC